MTHHDLEKMCGLVDDLCLINSGWRTPEEHADYLAALGRVASHGSSVKQRLEIGRLKARIEELEGKA